MEKKTIGSFIAALRKAHGMTQKELAERLNVSDKTVSRWERDDGAPDLSAIPVIAEIFSVTCDELLRGERRSPAERTDAPEEAELTSKGEKQRRHLLGDTLSLFQNRTFIAVGVSLAGLIAALIANLAFLKAVLGFWLGTLFFAGSVICQLIFMNRAFFRVENAELDEQTLGQYKHTVILLSEKSIGWTVALLGFTVPLASVDAYLGLTADYLMLWGSVWAIVFLLMYAVVLYFVNDNLLKKGVFLLTQAESAKYHFNRNLKKKCTAVLSAVLVFTLLFHGLGTELLWSTERIASSYGIVFEDYESFIEYMAREEASYEVNYIDGLWSAENIQTVAPEHAAPYDPEWYDEHGNPITEEEALTQTLQDANGNVVCTYISRNTNVSSIEYTPQEGTVLPIRVLTTHDWRAAVRLSEFISSAYCLTYPAELLCALLIYRKKRAR